MDLKPPGPRNTIELIRKQAEFYEKGKLIIGLGEVIRENLPAETREEFRDTIDEWRERLADAVNRFEAKLIPIHEALPVAIAVLEEMMEFAEETAHLSKEQLSYENLMARNEEIVKQIQKMLLDDSGESVK
ncbi:MAG: hypothetical protein WAV15_04430 [Minisyncoccia bacterium]